jgi:hypothetical protein
MRLCGVLIATLMALVLVVMPPSSLHAADQSPFLLQDHGGVRVLRSLDPSKDFETAKLTEELDVAPAAGPEPQVEPSGVRPQAGPTLTARRIALQRARQRGITVHGPGG